MLACFSACMLACLARKLFVSVFVSLCCLLVCFLAELFYVFGLRCSFVLVVVCYVLGLPLDSVLSDKVQIINCNFLMYDVMPPGEH